MVKGSPYMLALIFRCLVQFMSWSLFVFFTKIVEKTTIHINGHVNENYVKTVTIAILHIWPQIQDIFLYNNKLRPERMKN